jgi:hypothetical protein
MRFKVMLLIAFGMYMQMSILAESEQVFTAKPVAKKQSNNALKEKIVQQAKEILHACNEMARMLSCEQDFILIQLQDMADGTAFFEQADNKDLTHCMHELEKLSNLIQDMRIKISQQVHHAFVCRKK